MNEAYLELLERQARRGFGMLPDRARNVARVQADYERRKNLASAFGNWIAESLGPWDWFINPFSFRDRHPEELGELYRQYDRGPIDIRHGVKIYATDPKLIDWQPDFLGRRNPGPPVADKALAEVEEWLFALQEQAGEPIRWMIAEESGRIGGRFHCHALVSGVAHLRRDEWWKKAYDQFGRTRISEFDPRQGGAFYAAKYAAKQLGALHFGGPGPGAEFAAILHSGSEVGRVLVRRTAEMTRDAIRRTELLPRGWANWRTKR